jgi:hypothetical protein
MTRRALALGIALGIVVSLATYFNDWVIGQTLFIGNFLPISIFGAVTVLTIVINPLLARVSGPLAWQGREIALVTAIALASCGWPGSNFYRYFTPITALPAHWLKTTPSWQSAEVMSYVPGASAELGRGHVQDFARAVRTLAAAASEAGPSPARQLWLAIGEDGRRLVNEALTRGHADPGIAAELTRALNRALARPELYDPAAFASVSLSGELAALVARPSLEPHELVLRNRLLIVSAFPELFLPPPHGTGALADHGRADPLVVDTLMQGRSSSNRLGLLDLPWKAWWPTYRLWGGSALLLGLCSLCLALVVHPQWSKRELLPYPIVRFVQEASERATGEILPAVAKNKLFWVAFWLIVFWHTLNGLHAWFPEVPEIPRRFEFWSLTALFPNASRVNGQYGWFAPTIYLSVIAFSFFMSTPVAFSLGFAHPLFMALGSVLIVNGVQLNTTTSGASPSNLLRFGGYLGATLIIGYTGRRYYKELVLAALRLGRASDAPGYAVWALRCLCLCALLTVWTLTTSGASWAFAGLFVLLCLMTFLVITRIVSETGNFFVQTSWGPAAVLTALLGFEAVGPTTFILLALATSVVIPDPREALMPFLATGIKATERDPTTAPGRIAPWLLLMIVLGFVLAGAVTQYFQYNYSVIQVGNTWATHMAPKEPFDTLTRLIANAEATGTLSEATRVSGLEALGRVAPARGALLWTGVGLVLVLGTSLARLKLPWWPLHAVMFLVWDTYSMIVFGPSFLLGWMVKAAVVSAGGARAYHAVKPLMIGVISAELLCGLFWMAVGFAYYLTTGLRPVNYTIFPF